MNQYPTTRATTMDLGKTLSLWAAGLALAAAALVGVAFWLWPATPHRHALPATEPASTTPAIDVAAAPSPTPAIADLPNADLPQRGCSYSNKDGACSTTQAVLMRKDPGGKCYGCMVEKGCIDDAPAGSLPVKTFGDTGLECSDLLAGGGPGDEKLCLDALACAFSTDCPRSPDPSKIAASDNCYCGKESGNACLAGKGSGACKAAYESAAKSQRPGDVIARMANPNVPLGKANTMVQCAVNNKCTACY